MQNRGIFFVYINILKYCNIKRPYNNAQIEGLTRCAPCLQGPEKCHGVNMMTSSSFQSIYNDYISGYFWLSLSVNNQPNLQFSFTAFLAQLLKSLLLLQ